MKTPMYRVIFINGEERKMNFEEIRKMLILKKINYLGDISANCKEEITKQQLLNEMLKVAADMSRLVYANHPFEDTFSAIATEENLDISGVSE